MDRDNLKIVACSGASNTGAYADLTARKLMITGAANMMCLTRFSIDKEFTEATKAKIDNLIVLDGCDINCGKKILIQAGLSNFIHIKTTDFGIVKGKTAVSEDKINEIAQYIVKLNAPDRNNN